MSEAKQAKVAKCAESMWKLTYYATVLMVLYHEPWTIDMKEYFRGMPNQELKFYRIRLIVLALHDASDVFMEAAKVLKYSEKELAASVQLVGFFARSWFILQLIFFSFWVIRNASYDLIEFSIRGVPSEITTIGFVLMLNIHIIESFYRIDFIVLALHDASDVFMEAAKVLKYSEKELAASVLFGFFALSWFILRLIFFPFWVIRNSYDLIEFLKAYPHILVLYFQYHANDFRF